MELQHLRYYVDIARLESVSRAAERNHVAQPAMSRVVALLEREFGVALFDRVGRNIRLNACGKILLKAAEQSLSILDSVQEEIDYYNGHMTGEVKVCLQAPLREFSALCQSFREIYPLVELDVQKPSIDECTQLSPEYDLFIYMGPAMHNGDYQTGELLKEEVVALVSKKNPLAQRDEISLRDLAQQEFVMPQVYMLQKLVIADCYQAGFVPQKIGVANHPSGQQMLIDTLPERRAVVAFKAFTDVWSDDYKMLPITEPDCGVAVNLAWSRANPLRPSAEAFRDYTLRFFQEKNMPPEALARQERTGS